MQHTPIVIDNGGDTCKLGKLNCDGLPTQANPIVFPNCVAKTRNDIRSLVGDEINTIRNPTQLSYTRPLERGYVTDWDTQIDVWDRAFGPKFLDVDPAEHALLATEAPFAPEIAARLYDQVVFEHFGFAKCYRTSPAVLSALEHQEAHPNSRFASSPCRVVVDSGYSMSTVMPMVGNQMLDYATQRVDVGGKLLTNYMKELVSYRHWNMMEETHVIEEAKRKLCYVSTNFTAELNESSKPKKRNSIWRNYALPDFHHTMHGQVVPRDGGKPAADAKQQLLFVNNERITVPEVLFHPSDIGLNQAGIPEVVARSVGRCSEAKQSYMCSSILLTGGNSLFPNFDERMRVALRAALPSDFDMCVEVADDPITSAYRGGVRLAGTQAFEDLVVTKQEYDEYGSSICRKRFHHGLNDKMVRWK